MIWASSSSWLVVVVMVVVAVWRESFDLGLARSCDCPSTPDNPNCGASHDDVAPISHKYAGIRQFLSSWAMQPQSKIRGSADPL